MPSDHRTVQDGWRPSLVLPRASSGADRAASAGVATCAFAPKRRPVRWRWHYRCFSLSAACSGRSAGFGFCGSARRRPEEERMPGRRGPAAESRPALGSTPGVTTGAFRRPPPELGLGSCAPDGHVRSIPPAGRTGAGSRGALKGPPGRGRPRLKTCGQGARVRWRCARWLSPARESPASRLC
jgi:hypothetical protein